MVLAEYYPRAWGHLQAASDRKRELAAKWNAALADGLLGHEVVTDPNGSGRIVVLAAWPPGLQDGLTELFAGCLRELWACLDSLDVESVEAFSVLKNPRNMAAPRFFPMAGSADGFVALLEEFCLDGILRLHFQMIRDCQPFQTDPDDERIGRFRVGLHRLLEWENALIDGAVMSAWATPADPQIRVGAPVTLDWIEPAEPGELRDERIVARYQVRNYQLGRSVEGRSGTCFPWPSSEVARAPAPSPPPSRRPARQRPGAHPRPGRR